MPVYTYRCPDHGDFDSREPYDMDTIHCPCGRASSRTSVYRLNFGGFASTPQGQQDYHQHYRRFREASEGLAEAVAVRDRETGEQHDSPLFHAAMDKASDLAAKGVTADTFKPAGGD